MFRPILIVTGLFIFVGCANTSPPSNSTSSNSTQTPGNSDDTVQLVAYSARATLPESSNKPRSDLLLAVVVDRNSGAIHLYNFTDKPVAGGNIWINRNYVQRLTIIPPRGHVVMPREKFYDANGQSLAGGGTPPESVLLQWENETYQLLGPVFQ